jgi:hypothetical protein
VTTGEFSAVQSQVDDLIRGPQYARTQAEKDGILLPILTCLCRETADRCEPYCRFLAKLGKPIGDWQSVADIPPLPVSMFKEFLLSTVPPSAIVRELQSSATAGQRPSRILIDKTTAFRQARALAAILKEFIGGSRRPFLVIDASETLGEGSNLTARGAGVRGVANFASSTAFAVRRLPAGDLESDFDAACRFFEEHGRGPVLLFGFTFIVWTRFVLEAERRGVTFDAPEAFLLHSGGWKKLAEQAVTRDEFRRRTAAVLGCDDRRVLDFYGMVEQVGTVFVDCPAGSKHAPAFGDVLLRRPNTLQPVQAGETGIIEVVSALPTSYPGQALITEDQGRLLGVDDCPCGWKGRYFEFTKRIERAELRGCGDIFAQSRKSL